MAKIVYLVRPGQDYRDGSLSPRGVNQIVITSRLIREELGNLEGVVIYHSPLKRAAESAQVMSTELGGIPTVPREELKCDSYRVSQVIDGIKDRGVIISHISDLEDYLEKQRIVGLAFSNGQAHRLEL
ncbi:MAG TPA: phosphoglycerate mutase family protein [Candidatus Nanoarchaeia archaeon]|nr:phosphoglycerate mutase family protein [Candidatus Nanoarchaeia archaeon]